MQQLEVEYVYRDANNFKKFSSVVVENAERLTPEGFQTALRARFSHCQVWGDILHFEPEALGWPVLYFDRKTADDLTVHEIVRVSATAESPDQPMPDLRGNSG